jgi:hypothetical protein
MGDFAEQTHGLDFGNASERRKKVLEDLLFVFRSWAKKASEMAKSNEINFEDDLSDIASYARFLEVMKHVTEEQGIGVNSLDKIINSSLKSLEKDVLSLFKSCCDDMKHSDFDPESAVQLKLRWMRDVCDRFSTLHSNCGSELYSLFFAVVNKIKSSLLSTSGELENMSRFTKENGVTNGEKLGKEVANFKKCRWFDSYLPKGEAFVTNCCIAIERTIETRIEAKSIELSQAANCLGKGDSAESITSLGMLLPELREIDNYLVILEKDEHPASPAPEIVRNVDSDVSIRNTRSCSTCNVRLSKTEFSKNQWHKGETARCKGCVESKNKLTREGMSSTLEDVTMEDAESPSALSKLSLLAPKCVKRLKDYTSQLSKESRQRIDEWTAEVNRGKVDLLPAIAQDLEFIFVDATALNNIHSVEAVLQESQSIIDRIFTGCEILSALVDSELSRFGGDFLLKASILNLIASCNCLPHIGRKFPVSSDIQIQVRKLIAVEAQRLENEIEATSDWDKIDKQIELFEKAVVLDDFVSGEATARLSTLNRLREKKEGQVDEHLQSMIKVNNFKGIAEFLTPLAGSKDQIKKQRYQSYLDEIVFNLELTIKDVKRCMGQDSLASSFTKALPTDEDTIKVIAQKMIILATAKDSLCLLVRPKIDLASEFGHLGAMINNGVVPLLKEISEYTDKKDFVRAATSNCQVSVVVQHLGRYIKPINSKKQKTANAIYEGELNSVPGYVDTFFQSSFRNRNDLLKSLASLREAKDSNDTSVERLAALYDKTRKLLLDKVRDFVADVRENVSEADCFDDVIPILHVLQREMNGPFKSHFPNDIVLECSNLLERLQQEKSERDRLLAFGEADMKETVELWRKKLDKLQSPALFRRWRWLWFDDKRSYNNLKEDLRRKCNERLKQAHDALRPRDLRTVQESIDFLVLVEKELHAHVEIRTQLQQLQERCINAFLDLCQQVGDMLKKKDISKFEEKFVDYRGFVFHIRSISTSKQAQKEFALVNQMLYESFIYHIDSFHALVKAESLDFSNIRSQVLQLRKVGEFMADRVTLFNEEMKYSMAEKIQDQWLEKIQDLCSKHFGSGRDLSKLKCCVDLGVVPSATQKRDKERI